MKLLLDTHLLLWAAYNPKRLTKAARALIDDFKNELVFSAASLWEITIKQSLGRQDFHVNGTLLRVNSRDGQKSKCPIWSRLRELWSHFPLSSCTRSCAAQILGYASGRVLETAG